MGRWIVVTGTLTLVLACAIDPVPVPQSGSGAAGSAVANGGRGGGGDGAAGAGGAAATPAQIAACRAFHAKECAAIAACLPEELATVFGDEASCVDRLTGRCLLSFAVGSVQTAEELAQCAVELDIAA